MIVVVGVRNVRAVNIFQFDFKAVSFDFGVVDTIEVVEATIGGTGFYRWGQGKNQ